MKLQPECEEVRVQGSAKLHLLPWTWATEDETGWKCATITFLLCNINFLSLTCCYNISLKLYYCVFWGFSARAICDISGIFCSFCHASWHRWKKGAAGHSSDRITTFSLISYCSQGYLWFVPIVSLRYEPLALTVWISKATGWRGALRCTCGRSGLPLISILMSLLAYNMPYAGTETRLKSDCRIAPLQLRSFFKWVLVGSLSFLLAFKSHDINMN